jgi:RNA polymerase sigma-70 factor (ECF subfamily)
MREAVIVPHGFDREEIVDELVLIQAIRADPAAFGQLYEQYGDRLYWYLRARTLSEEDAADLLQQVFLQALDRISQYNSKKGPFVAWLFGIARNAASNHHRGRRTTVSWDLVPDVLRPGSQDDPESSALRNESLDRLTDIFATLNPDKRELLVLRYIVGVSVVEVGAIVGKSEAATRQQVSRLLRSLKEHYRDGA